MSEAYPCEAGSRTDGLVCGQRSRAFLAPSANKQRPNYRFRRAWSKSVWWWTERAATRSLSFLVFLNVDPHGPTLTPANGRWVGHATAAFIELDAKGAVLGNGIVEQTVDMNLSPETYNHLMHSVLNLEKKLSLEPTAAELCVIVLDEGTGRVGSIRVPISEYQQSPQSHGVQ